jgi:uncharacterized protein with FMN-binding domain
MRRITIWLFSTLAAVVLLFSYRTSAGSGGAEQSPVAVAEAPAAAPGAKTYSGAVAQTRWGPVQVSITVTAGKITDVAVPIYPSGNGRDQEINAYALPVLRKETLSAQNASINGVSGATVTSDGYKQSLQAALDAAHLA